MPGEMSVMHDASKRLQARPFGTETASSMVITAPATRVSPSLLGLCVVVSWVVPLVYLWF
jgi:hypothetical protein